MIAHPLIAGRAIGILCFIHLSNLGHNDIWNPNEGYYADAAREMF